MADGEELLTPPDVQRLQDMPAESQFSGAGAGGLPCDRKLGRAGSKSAGEPKLAGVGWGGGRRMDLLTPHTLPLSPKD